MLASFVVLLKPLKRPEEDFEKPEPRQARGILYNLLELADPELGKKLHQQQSALPFTAGWLSRRHFRRPADHLALRITTLTAPLFAALEGILTQFQQEGRSLWVNSRSCAVVDLLWASTRTPFAATTTYEALWQALQPTTWGFRFMTPTLFKTGDGFLPFPLPQSVYRSLAAKWTAFAPPDLALPEGFVPQVQRYLFPSQFHLDSAVQVDSRRPQIGFVGCCAYTFIGDPPDSLPPAVAALNEFARYAGVGIEVIPEEGLLQSPFKPLVSNHHQTVGIEVIPEEGLLRFYGDVVLIVSCVGIEVIPTAGRG